MLHKPLVFVAAVVLGYFIAIFPVLTYRSFDPSIFIVAGDKFVDANELASHDAGYDGQFYYRLALAPFSLQQKAFGVAFNAPAYRMQRIGYPLIAWGLSLNRAAWAGTKPDGKSSSAMRLMEPARMRKRNGRLIGAIKDMHRMHTGSVFQCCR